MPSNRPQRVPAANHRDTSPDDSNISDSSSNTNHRHRLGRKSGTRERTGCLSCRLRHKTCSDPLSPETDPQMPCGACQKLRIECLGYYYKRPEWLKIEGTAKQITNCIKHHTSIRKSERQLLGFSGFYGASGHKSARFPDPEDSPHSMTYNPLLHITSPYPPDFSSVPHETSAPSIFWGQVQSYMGFPSYPAHPLDAYSVSAQFGYEGLGGASTNLSSALLETALSAHLPPSFHAAEAYLLDHANTSATASDTGEDSATFTISPYFQSPPPALSPSPPSSYTQVSSDGSY